MRDKIEINGIIFNLSNVPNYFMNTYQYGFTLICTNIEVSTIKKWCVMQDVFYFEPFDNDVMIEQISTTSYHEGIYSMELTLAKVTKSNVIS